MKNIVLFGAGKSATCLIDYLVNICTKKNWSLFIGDADMDSLNKKLPVSPAVHPVKVNVENHAERISLIQKADLVISLLPPALHIFIARDCLIHSRNLLTASYVDDEIRLLSNEIKAKKLIFLCEMGLDPGIDHMSAMQLIHRIKDEGGLISSFRSHTGGLVAPESDDNPWHYKISWNPSNVVRAGSAGAVYKENNRIINLDYQSLFEHTGEVEIKPLGNFSYYPNRDSLAYIPVYGLEKAHTFIRTTLRHPVYCNGWKNLVSAKLTLEKIIPSSDKTFADWSAPLLPFIDDDNKYLYTSLGLFENQLLPDGIRNSSKILQYILEKKWMMQPYDKDMILMMHEFEYRIGVQNKKLKSSLIVKGENALKTAMAKTVGLPLGIAAKLILENKMSLFGLQIPTIKEIYEPVLEELAREGICFKEMAN